MSHTFARIHIHIIFSTKDRRRMITREIQPRLWSYMTGICRNKGIEPIAINGMDNHVHVLIHLPPAIALAKAVNFIKANSSSWMKDHRLKFAWQDGYGAFSVSESNTADVISYIRNQEKHHQKRTFEEEFLMFLKNTGSNMTRNMCLDDDWGCGAPPGLDLLLSSPTAYAVGSVIPPLRGCNMGYVNLLRMPVDLKQTEGLKKIDRDFLHTIDKYGWHVMSVAPLLGEEGHIWSYSTGLFYHFKHPEIIVLGQSIDLMQTMINVIGERVRRGEIFRPGQGYAGIIDKYDCQFRTVHTSQYWNYVNFSCWFYDNDETRFPLLQCFWPDMKSRFPWQRACAKWAIDAQPLLFKSDSKN